MAIYPPGAKPGEEREFTFIGDPGGAIKSLIKLPDEERQFSGLVKNGDWHTPSGIPVRLSPLPYVNEVEPNEGSKEATPAEALPAREIEGVILGLNALDLRAKPEVLRGGTGA